MSNGTIQKKGKNRETIELLKTKSLKETAFHSGVLPGKSHGQRNLEGYSPWGHKELDTAHTHSRCEDIHLYETMPNCFPKWNHEYSCLKCVKNGYWVLSNFLNFLKQSVNYGLDLHFPYY